MAKKYVWVVVALMVLTMVTILIEKGFRKEPKEEINQKEEVILDDKKDSESEVVVGDNPEIKPETTVSIPKGKLPAGSAPAVDPKEIQSKTWVWQKTVMSDGSVVIPKKIGIFTLEMKPDGNLSGKTDCNGFFGDYKIGTDGVISVGPLASTMMFCEGSQEREYTNAISTSSRYMLDESGNLVLLLQYDSGSVFFKKL